MHRAALLFAVAAALWSAEAFAQCQSGAKYCSATICCNPPKTVCVSEGNGDYACCSTEYPVGCSDGQHCGRTQQACDCYTQGKEPCGSGCMPKGGVCCDDSTSGSSSGTYCGAGLQCGCGGCMPAGSVCCGNGKTCPSGKECKCGGCVDPGSVCCSDGKTCPSDTACDSCGCIPQGGSCCGTGACGSSTVCCNDLKCIPSGTACCSNGNYCPASLQCNGTQCGGAAQTRPASCPPAGYPTYTVSCSSGAYCCPLGTSCGPTAGQCFASTSTATITPSPVRPRTDAGATSFTTDAGGGPVGELKWGCSASAGGGALWALLLLVPLALRRRRWTGAALALVLCAPLAAQAQGAKGEACTEGRVKGPDTAGHCCWPNQVWSNLRNTCVGIPACPSNLRAEGESCVVSCPPGQAVSPDTQGRCCWPGQVWSSSRNLCVGIPTCPAGQRAEGESCVVACPPGQLATADTQGRCCWPNQVWSNSRQACMGTPTCPEGYAAAGAECVAQAAAAPVQPAPGQPPLVDSGPQPVDTSPPPDAAPVPMDTAPVPMDSAPVPVDAAPVPVDSGPIAASPTPARAVLVEAREQEELRRSLWVLGVDFLIDMSSGRFGLRLRTDIPLGRSHFPGQLGFGLGILPPSFMSPTTNTAWAIPAEITFGWRIPLGGPPRVHLVPRAGLTPHLMLSDRGVELGLKVLIGIGGRLNFGSSLGLNLGFDALIPVARTGGPPATGFVWLTTIGISV